MKIVVIGAKGLFGSAIVKYWNHCGPQKDQIIPLDLPDFDICSRFFVQELLGRILPDVIINASGSGQIDWMESHPQRAVHFHVHGSEYVRDAAEKTGAFLVQLSCGEIFQRKDLSSERKEDSSPSEEEIWFSSDQDADSSFDRKGDSLSSGSSDSLSTDKEGDFSSHKEEDLPACQSIFARTKWEAEQSVREYDRSLVIRTSAPFGISGENSGCGNIAETLLNVLHRTRALQVLNDVRISPVFVPEAVRALRFLVQREETGLYHLAGPDSATPMEIAQYLREKCFGNSLDGKIEKKSPELIPITYEEYGIQAPRSRNTSLDANKYHLLEEAPPFSSWKEAMNDFLEIRQPFLPFLDPAY
ncbi:MAG: sugar nucleotide-binding protein [Planctomycetia bacterium]|nr:sugar nucleotide-binding protein [Planctomycetia bacterium]